MQREAGESGGALPVKPGDIEAAGRDPEQRSGISCIEMQHGTPDIRLCGAVIDKECIAPGSSGEKVRSGSAIQHINPANRGNRVVSRSAVQEPVVAGYRYIDIIVAGIDILLR